MLLQNLKHIAYKTMSNPVVKYRKDYTPSNYQIHSTYLTFHLHKQKTIVTAKIEFTRSNNILDHSPLILNGMDLKIVALKLNGTKLSDNDYFSDDLHLTIPVVPSKFTLETIVEINPEKNTSLEGLYVSGDMFCTQCESTGFQKITYYLDRPDVMTTYTVKIIADKDKYPVILSNGNNIEHGDLPDGKHFAIWNDPFKKPSYLFALVAGDLANIKDTFITQSGRKIDLEIYAFKNDIDKCHHAMESLKQSMKWDEERFNLEYDLDTFMIVAVPDFNAGAMENKGLNLFNTKYILASDKTATDKDFEMIQAVVGHEYFHNWTGDRVTCRDWFELSLKEGLTVFRDQEFTSDLNSRDVKRIGDVKALRNAQFAEDASPMSHPIRPESYIEMNNFYTMTVYNKGAEVIRMLHTLLDESGFQKGMKLYFERHDGQAVTCDDFVNAMADANDCDLSLFKQWYSQSGTPELNVTENFDATNKTYTLTIEQHTPSTADQKEKKSLHIPIKTGLIFSDGENSQEKILELKDKKQSFTFEGIEEKPTPSLLRDFSAPVKIKFNYTEEDLLHLMKFDTNAFNRWEAGQVLATQTILAAKDYSSDFIEAIQSILNDNKLDKSLICEAILTPTETTLAEGMDIIFVDNITIARNKVISQLGQSLKANWLAIYESCTNSKAFSLEQKEVGNRRLKGLSLYYLMHAEDQTIGTDLALQLFKDANNMTDQLSAFSALLQSSEEGIRQKAIDVFYNQWHKEDLVVNKWLQLQAWMPYDNTVEKVKKLLDHPAYNNKNPNKVYSLIGGFSGNFTQFHHRDGSGYEFFADRVLEIDVINPQISSRLARSLMNWKRYDNDHQLLMKKSLEKIDSSDISKNLFEVINKSLNS